MPAQYGAVSLGAISNKVSHDTGKTVQALTLIGMLMRAGRAYNALVIVPVNVALKWKSEACRFLKGVVPDVHVDLLVSSTEAKAIIRRKQVVKKALIASSSW